jgi:hypothetical protein
MMTVLSFGRIVGIVSLALGISMAASRTMAQIPLEQALAKRKTRSGRV